MKMSQPVKWIAGFTAGVGTLIWIFSIFLTKESHRTYVESHKQWSEAVLNEIRGDIIEMKMDIREIKVSVIGKRVAGLLNTNVYE